MKASDLGSLVERARTDRSAVTSLFAHFGSAVYGWALRIVNDPHDAEDVRQEVFIQVLQKLSEMKEACAFPKWIRRITHNLAINFSKRNARRRSFLNAEQWGSIPATLESPLDIVLEAEERAAIGLGLQGLQPQIREMLEAHHLQGRSLGQISGAQGLSVSKIKGILFRGRISLRVSVQRSA